MIHDNVEHLQEYQEALREVRAGLADRLWAKEFNLEAIWLRMCLGYPCDYYVGAVRMEGVRVQKVTTSA
jgi:hypothetical protein